MSRRDTLVLFDIGSVLVKLDFNRFYQRCAEASGQNPEEFRKSYFQLEMDSLMGAVTAQEYLNRLQRLLKTRLTERELRDITSLTWPGQIDEVVDLKRKVYENGYAVGLLSNTGEIGIEILSQKYPQVYDLFEPSFPAVYSCRVKHMKPDPEIYRHVKGFSNVILIDDKSSYLKTGTEMGWKGIWFTAHIDTAESVRSIHPEISVTKGVVKAGSFNELEESLRSFDIKV